MIVQAFDSLCGICFLIIIHSSNVSGFIPTFHLSRHHHSIQSTAPIHPSPVLLSVKKTTQPADKSANKSPRKSPPTASRGSNKKTSQSSGRSAEKNGVRSNNPTKRSSDHRTSPFKASKVKFNETMIELKTKHEAGENLTQPYFDSVIGLCVSLDKWDAVLEVLDIGKGAGLAQERSTYRACIQACFEVGNGASAEEILKAMESAFVLPKPADISLVVATMCRNSKSDSTWWRKALSILTSTAMDVVDDESAISVDAYDAVFSCMSDGRQWQEATKLLRMMEDGSSGTRALQKKVGIHPAPHLSTYRSVIQCCVSSGQAEPAVQIILSMRAKGIVPTAYAFELVIAALSKKLQWRRALQLLVMMEELDVPRTVVTYNTVIGSCAKAREVGTAKNLLSRMRKQGINPDVISFNAVIGACANTNRWKDALTVLDQCHREPGVTPDIYTYTNAMRACAKGGLTDRALGILQVAKDKGLPVDSYCYTAVIDACSKARMWQKALALLEEMKERGVEPSQVTYSVAISACGNGGQWRKALDLLDEMRRDNMKINLITYNNAITALSKASRKRGKGRYAKHSAERTDSERNSNSQTSLFDMALSLIEQMKKDGLEPDGFSYTPAIGCCGAEGRWQEALDMIKLMKKGGPKTRPNKVAYTAAITACGRVGQYTHALDLFRSMKDEGLSADKVAYNALFSALRVAKQADATYELWGEMCGQRSTITGNPRAIATARDNSTPDIITVTDCIDTLSRAGQMERVDEVFDEAVRRGIVLRGSNSLDSDYDIDLSGMTFPVARAAVRHIVLKAKDCARRGQDVSDISFITGVGVAHYNKSPPLSPPSKEKSAPQHAANSDGKVVSTLRDYVQEILEEDFQPEIKSEIPRFQQGTVLIEKKSLLITE